MHLSNRAGKISSIALYMGKINNIVTVMLKKSEQIYSDDYCICAKLDVSFYTQKVHWNVGLGPGS